MSMLDHPTYRGMLSAFAGFCAFAGADSCAKWLGGHYDVKVVILWTYLISFVFGLMISPLLGGIKKTLKTPKLAIHLGRGIFSLGISACAITSLSQGLSLAHFYTIIFLAPFLITLAAWPIFKEKIAFKTLLIIALGFSGIIVAFRPGLADLTMPVLYAVGALFFIVGLSMLARPLDERESLLSLSFYPAVVICTLVFPFTWNIMELPATRHIPIFILNGMFVTLGLSGIAYGFRIAPFSIIAPIHYTQIIIAIVVGMLVFHDYPDLWMLAGASIIIASGIWLVLHVRKRTQPPVIKGAPPYGH